jgi:hypothetical protein
MFKEIHKQIKNPKTTQEQLPEHISERLWASQHPEVCQVRLEVRSPRQTPVRCVR